MKRFLIAVVFLALACGAQAQQRGLVGSFTLTSTVCTNSTTNAFTGTALDLPSVDKLYVWLTLYGGPEGTSTGAVTVVMGGSPDNTTWPTVHDTNFLLTCTMVGTNKITVLKEFDITGMRYFKPVGIYNEDTVSTVTNISIVYASKK